MSSSAIVIIIKIIRQQFSISNHPFFYTRCCVKLGPVFVSVSELLMYRCVYTFCGAFMFVCIHFQCNYFFCECATFEVGGKKRSSKLTPQLLWSVFSLAAVFRVGLCFVFGAHAVLTVFRETLGSFCHQARVTRPQFVMWY